MNIQIDDQIRSATTEEITRIEQIQESMTAKKAAFNTARNSAILKLKNLGLTDVEIAALVG